MDEEYVLRRAMPSDISEWMLLAGEVKENFPGFVEADYRQILERNIERGSALCVEYRGGIVGVLLYSIKNAALSCMAVHPKHRRRGVASSLIARMLYEFPAGMDIWVSTFREGDPLGDAPRALYKKFGFVEDALTIEFGYPNQRFVLRRGENDLFHE